MAEQKQPKRPAAGTALVELHEYTDAGGRRVTARVPVGDGETIFFGHAKGSIPVGPGKAVELTYQFPIPAGDIEEAFRLLEETNTASWPSIRKAQIENMREQARPKIVTAGMGAPPGVRGPLH